MWGEGVDQLVEHRTRDPKMGGSIKIGESFSELKALC